MAVFITLDRWTSRVMCSRWTVLAELLFVIAPVTVIMSLSLLILPVVLINPFAVPLLTIVTIGGIWGVASLWRVFFALIRQPVCPKWAQLGLLAGSVAVLIAFVFAKDKSWSPFLPCIAVAAHWYWLLRQGIRLSFRRARPS